MKVRWEASLILVLCFPIAIVLYLLQQELVLTYVVVAFLVNLAAVVQLSGFSLRGFFRERQAQTAPKIRVEHAHGEERTIEEKTWRMGTEAIERYMDSLSLLLDRSWFATEDIAAAAELVQSGRPDEANAKAAEAIGLLESRTIEQPTLPLSQAYLIRGDAAFGSRLFAAAERYYSSSYEKATLINDELLMTASAHGVAVAKGSQGNNVEALKILEQIIMSHPDNPKLWYNKGVALHQLGRHEHALSAFEEAIRLDPNCADAWHNKGISLYKLGRYREAMETLDHASHLVQMASQST